MTIDHKRPEHGTVIAPPPDTPAGFEELYEKNRLYCQKLLHIMTNYVIFCIRHECHKILIYCSYNILEYTNHIGT